jgi:hypothetical protein
MEAAETYSYDDQTMLVCYGTDGSWLLTEGTFTWALMVDNGGLVRSACRGIRSGLHRRTVLSGSKLGMRGALR